MRVSPVALAFVAVLGLLGSADSQEDPRTAASYGHHEIRAADLPKPVSYQDNGPVIVPKPGGAKLRLPHGFSIDTFADGLSAPRWLALAPNGDVFVSEGGASRITILRDTAGNGRATERFTFSDRLTQPFGMAFWQSYLYVADTDAVLRFNYKSGQTKAEGHSEWIATLPGLGYNQHWTRNLIFSPDASKMYVTVGSEPNADVESNPMRAAISQYNPDGTGHRIYASGIRNPVGLAFRPGTGELWTSVNERDELGDDLVPDYVTSVKDGGFYGWPFSYIGQNEDPRHKGDQPYLVRMAIVPDVLIQSHSAALGLVFYDGKMFPEEYRGDAFVALHGSWNRSKRTGYKIVRIHFKDGKPVGGYDDFITGWMLGEDNPDVWGRPVGLLVAKDGSLLIADDAGKTIWRVSYRAPGAKELPAR